LIRLVFCSKYAKFFEAFTLETKTETALCWHSSVTYLHSISVVNVQNVQETFWWTDK